MARRFFWKAADSRLMAGSADGLAKMQPQRTKVSATRASINGFGDLRVRRQRN